MLHGGYVKRLNLQWSCILLIKTVQLFAASEAFFVAATFTAKSAVLLTIEKLLGRHMKEWRAVFQYTIGVVAFAGLASILAVTVDCSESTCNYVSIIPFLEVVVTSADCDLATEMDCCDCH